MHRSGVLLTICPTNDSQTNRSSNHSTLPSVHPRIRRSTIFQESSPSSLSLSGMCMFVCPTVCPSTGHIHSSVRPPVCLRQWCFPEPRVRPRPHSRHPVLDAPLSHIQHFSPTAAHRQFIPLAIDVNIWNRGAPLFSNFHELWVSRNMSVSPRPLVVHLPFPQPSPLRALHHLKFL